MKCDPLDRPKNICPTQQEIFDQICVMIPQGRAWQTNAQFVPRSKSIMGRFWWAIAGYYEFVNKKMCDVLDEFFCDTVNELRQSAEDDYGIPDRCGNIREICTLKKFLPEDTCEFYKALALEIGYVIQCETPEDCPCGAPGNGLMRVGHTSFCESENETLIIRISDRYKPKPDCSLMTMGHSGFGCDFTCDTVPKDLFCLLDMIVPAYLDVRIFYFEEVQTLPPLILN